MIIGLDDEGESADDGNGNLVLDDESATMAITAIDPLKPKEKCRNNIIHLFRHHNKRNLKNKGFSTHGNISRSLPQY